MAHEIDSDELNRARQMVARREEMNNELLELILSFHAQGHPPLEIALCLVSAGASTADAFGVVPEVIQFMQETANDLRNEAN